jgi:hypothetical protein
MFINIPNVRRGKLGRVSIQTDNPEPTGSNPHGLTSLPEGDCLLTLQVVAQSQHQGGAGENGNAPVKKRKPPRPLGDRFQSLSALQPHQESNSNERVTFALASTTASNSWTWKSRGGHNALRGSFLNLPIIIVVPQNRADLHVLNGFVTRPSFEFDA